MPLLIDLRADPFERTPEESFGYPQWLAERMFFMVPAQATVKAFVNTLKDFPPRQKSASWSLDEVLETASHAGGAAK
jgi:arylsulfatase